MGFDKDRDESAFEFYKMMYTDLPWALFDFDNLEKDKNGYFAILKTEEDLELANLPQYTDLIKQYGGILRLSGDTDFGMKCESTFYKNKKAYNCVCKLIQNPDEIMHLNCNFSLMAVNGGMNCRKGLKNCYRDIFPRFLHAIWQYYNETNNVEKRIIVESKLGGAETVGGRPSAGMTNKEYKAKKEEQRRNFYNIDIPALMCFLDTFNSFEDYCIRTYFQGDNSEDIKKLLNDIKTFGSEVDNASFFEDQRISEYCNLAKRYWKTRNRIIIEKTKGKA